MDFQRQLAVVRRRADRTLISAAGRPPVSKPGQFGADDFDFQQHWRNGSQCPGPANRSQHADPVWHILYRRNIDFGWHPAGDERQLGRTGAVTLDGGAFQADGFSDLTFTNDFKVNSTGGTIDNKASCWALRDLQRQWHHRRAAAGRPWHYRALRQQHLYRRHQCVERHAAGDQQQLGRHQGRSRSITALFQADGVSNLTFSNNFRINNSAIGSAIDANGIDADDRRQHHRRHRGRQAHGAG